MWQGVALLPFVDETRLLRALNEYYHTLTPEESDYCSILYCMYMYMPCLFLMYIHVDVVVNDVC